MNGTENWIQGKKILVTGGAGAFGKNFIKWVRDQAPASVTVFSRDEMKHSALRREFPAKDMPWLKYMIGDILSPEDLELATSDIDLVVHAAAMKHLPECEFNVAASTRVNVSGTHNVVRAFLKSRASTLIFLSTDKAPYASSVYGAQKYTGEKLVSEVTKLSLSGKRAFSLRYSNVMDSTGSVFHIFNQLLSAGKTASVNGTQTCRGFVSQSQVLKCIHHALACAQGGETFVIIPQVVKIAELAQAMHELIGKGSVNITETTSFQGEKESATLVMGEELGQMKEFPEYTSGKAYLLDIYNRHASRSLAKHGTGPVTLDDCPALSGAPLREFVRNLL